MTTTYKTPGVYIEELPAVGPIAGVGTSTAAFLGPARSGPIAVPTKVTNWTQFKDLFGEYNPSPTLYLPHAVRGYFANGGTVAYIARVGTAARAELPLDDRGGPASPTIVVRAKVEGPDGNGISVAVADAAIVAAAAGAVVRATRAPITGAAADTVTLANAAHGSRFKPGDIVTIEGSAERVEVDRVRGNEVILVANLAAGHGAGFVRIADLAVGQRKFRVVDGVSNATVLEPGSVIHLAQAAGNSEDIVVDAVSGEFVTVAAPGLASTYDLAQGASPVDVTSYEFTLTITKPADGITENFTRLSMDPRHSRYFGRTVVSTIVEVVAADPPSVQVPPDNRPAVAAATALAGGTADNPAAIGLNHYQTALTALEKVDDVNLVCAPDNQSTGVQGAIVAHCEKLADRFGILDSPRNIDPLNSPSVIDHRASVESQRGYAALYYPWVWINDPSSATGDDVLLIPPSGHLAGIYARSDTQRGVHKAPANEFITGAVGMERVLDDTEQGEINVEGVNALRIFPGEARPRVWGARTTAPKSEVAWRYVNVRRLFLFIEESIQEGIRWAVFEPNDLGLWKKLSHTITEFLTRVWRAGALFGATAEQAFYVKIDEELNPASVRALGQVIIEIGIAPVRPAEFVIVRIGMWDGGSEVNES